MSYEIYSSRPSDTRSDVEERVYNVLCELGIPFLRADHSPAATIAECGETEKLLDVSVCKNLFLTNNRKSIYCLLLLEGNKKYDAGKVSKQVGSSRLSFASDNELTEYLGLSSGSISILGLINDPQCKVTVAIDSDILKNEYFGCHPCKNTSTLKIKTDDITQKFIPYTKHSIIIIDI